MQSNSLSRSFGPRTNVGRYIGRLRGGKNRNDRHSDMENQGRDPGTHIFGLKMKIHHRWLVLDFGTSE